VKWFTPLYPWMTGLQAQYQVSQPNDNLHCCNEVMVLGLLASSCQCTQTVLYTPYATPFIERLSLFRQDISAVGSTPWDAHQKVCYLQPCFHRAFIRRPACNGIYNTMCQLLFSRILHPVNLCRPFTHCQHETWIRKYRTDSSFWTTISVLLPMSMCRARAASIYRSELSNDRIFWKSVQEKDVSGIQYSTTVR